MWLFEVHEGPRPGFKLVLDKGEADVLMGYDERVKGPTRLPLGNSIEGALVHPDDQQETFVLRHANLEEKNIGFCLTAQTKDEAAKDERALVLVDGCTDPEVGVTNIAEAYGKPMPELVTFTHGNGTTRRLYLFKPGDALFISWPARALESNRPKRFIISWDAQKKQLVEEAVGRPRRSSRPPKKVREAQKNQPRPPAAKELRA